MKVAGHAAMTVSQQDMHPAGETVQLALDKVEELHRKAREDAKDQNQRRFPIQVDLPWGYSLLNQIS